LFLLHLDDILPNVVKRGGSSTNAPIGCSTIVCNRPGEELLGHTEDALSPTLNHFYLVSAHVLPEPGLPQGRWKDAEERFTSLCYAGILPGFTMSYNHHGLVYSINVVSAATLVAGKTLPEIKGSMMESSDCRHKAISAHGEPENYGSIVNMLGDQTDPKFTVFQDKTDHVTTLAVGIFDCVKRTWSIYSDNPKKTEPIVVLPIQLKTDKKRGSASMRRVNLKKHQATMFPICVQWK
ncbi:Putative tan, partial [Gryllus bimaculatus]